MIQFYYLIFSFLVTDLSRLLKELRDVPMTCQSTSHRRRAWTAVTRLTPDTLQVLILIKILVNRLTQLITTTIVLTVVVLTLTNLTKLCQLNPTQILRSGSSLTPVEPTALTPPKTRSFTFLTLCITLQLITPLIACYSLTRLIAFLITALSAILLSLLTTQHFSADRSQISWKQDSNLIIPNLICTYVNSIWPNTNTIIWDFWVLKSIFIFKLL